MVEKGKQMGMVVPQITKDWRWSWIRKAEMKSFVDATDVEGSPVEEVAPPPNLAPASTQAQEDTEEEDVHEDTIMVEIGGEILEMTRTQARQMQILT
jgi:hypothetical protein